MTALHPAPLAPLVHGAAEITDGARGLGIHRLPASVRTRDADPQLATAEGQPSGVRLVFATTATRVELDTHATALVLPGIERPRGHVDVVVDGVLALRDELTGGDRRVLDPATGGVEIVPGPVHTTGVDLPGGEHLVELWLPHNETIELVGLRADAALRPVADERPLWVHHGSSISHGSNAAAPTGIWPVVAARAADVRLRNLGFGGSAMVDPFLARTIRDAPADVISVKLGINVVNADAFRLRAFVPAVHGFLDTIRDGHPDTPLLLVSPIFCGIHEETPGPGAFDPEGLRAGELRFVATGDPAEVARGRLSLQVIRTALREIIARRADDPHLHHLEGTVLYGAEDAVADPLPDGLHPGPETHLRMGERFAAHAFGPTGPFAAVRR